MGDAPEPVSALLTPLPPGASPDAVLERFLAAAAARGLELYPEQEEAVLELLGGRHVILNTPTGSGKSLVAEALLFRALCAGQRAVYTCPIKALVNEKFLALGRLFGADNVGLMTGDASVNRDAPLLCCTAEVLANLALGEGAATGVGAAVIDEFHYYGDEARGWAWQVPLLTLTRTQFLLMSATLGDTGFMERDLAGRTGRDVALVRSDRRPVPLEFEYSETPLTERVADLLAAGRAPVYLVYFTQRAAAEAAQNWMSLAVTTREERAVLGEALAGVDFSSPYGREMRRWLRHGIGVHHAGLLPKYRLLVEGLAQRGLLKLICGTDTLGVGINVPIRTVVFTQLWKYDGRKSAVLGVRDFRQISGRAGRRGFDDTGYVIAQAPEHIIENQRAAAKAAAGGGKKKTAKRTAPPGAVVWDEQTYARLRSAPTEAMVSRFTVTHGMLLQVLARDGDGCRAMRDLINACHEPPARRAALRRRAWQLFRALLDRGLIAWLTPTPTGRKLRVNVELQANFSLHQALSLYLIDTLPELDADAPEHAADVLSLSEAIVEDPEPILRRQLDKLKEEKLAEMKAEGVPYEERIAKLDELEHPKPLREFLYGTFNVWAAAHPWVEDENVRPKSIAREMYERGASFNDYVRAYGLERVEGLLLRHLAQVWKVLAHTVPDTAKTEPVRELEAWLRDLVRGTDASLLEEWERLRDPAYGPTRATEPTAPPVEPYGSDAAVLRREIRAAIWGFLAVASARDWEAAAARLAGPSDEESRQALARDLEAAFVTYAEARGRFRLDPAGRAAANTHFEPDEGIWEIAQVLVDAEEANDWELRLRLDLTASLEAATPVLAWVGLGPVAAS